MVQLLRDRQPLLSCLEKLQKLKKNRQIDEVGLDALIEANFRLAVNPETPLSQALALLRQNFHLDGANPKHAYHLARLYFAQGKFKHASHWLGIAVNLCPTSHRIWAHVSLLQWQMNAAYKGDDKFSPDALRKRGEEIAENIKGGNDRFKPEWGIFKPPKSQAAIEQERHQSNNKSSSSSKIPSESYSSNPNSWDDVRRIQRTGQCRWSGIHDLVFEHTLEGMATQENLKKRLADFEHILQIASNRRGGLAAFVIIAIEWMLCGYPVATVRRLRNDITQNDANKSFDLLDLVCELLEIAENEVPPRLALALTEDQIPPVLAALIHHRRLLWMPLEFRLGAYQNAQKFMKNNKETGSEDMISGHIRKLGQFLDSLNAPPPKALKDMPVVKAASSLNSKSLEKTDANGSIKERFAHLETTISKLTATYGYAFTYLQKNLEQHSQNISDDTTYSQVKSDRLFFKDLLDAFKCASEEGQKHLNKIIDEMAELDESDRIEDFETPKTRLNKAITELNTPGRFVRKLKAIDAKLDGVASTFADISCKPSNEISILLNIVKDAFPNTEAQSSTTPEEINDARINPDNASSAEVKIKKSGTSLLANLSGWSGLEIALNRVDEEIICQFDQALEGFEVYGSQLQKWRPLHELHYSVCARYADTLYRLGRLADARRVWNKMLKENRLDHNVLKNLAICDTHDASVFRNLNSWRSYIEMLYLRDLVDGNPQQNSCIRASFHRSFGHAYAPAFLTEKFDQKWPNTIDDQAFEDFIAFLNSPGRVQNFVEHKQLEFLNERLNFTSPLLILGVSRAEGEAKRKVAKEHMLEFIDQVTALLPNRARNTFPKLITRYLEEAYTASSSVNRLIMSNDPSFETNKKRFQEVLAEICQLKYKLVILVHPGTEEAKHRVVEMFKRLTTLDCLDKLALLDTIPIGTSPEFLRNIAQSLGVADYKELLTFIKQSFNGLIVQQLLKFIFSTSAEMTDSMAQERLYRRMVDDWVKRPALVESLDIIDDPHFAYPNEVITSLETGEASRETLDWLTQFHDSHPELTGPARWLAIIFKGQDKCQDAIKVLDQACKSGFHEKNKITCRFLRIHTWSRAAEIAIQANIDGDATKAWGEILSDSNYVIDHSENLKEVLDSRNCRMWAAYRQGEFALNRKRVGSACSFFEITCGEATYLIENATDKSDIESCYFCRMMAWYAHGIAVSSTNRANAKDYLQNALDDAFEVEQRSNNQNFLEPAKNIKDQVNEALSSI